MMRRNNCRIHSPQELCRFG